MPINNYANLKASIKRRSKRNDVSDADLTDYILQAEATFYNNPTTALRIRAMEARATAPTSITSRFLALPDDFLQMRRLKLNDPYSGSSGDTDVEYLTPEQMPLNNLVQIPCYFTVTSQIEFNSTPDKVYTTEMQYLQKIPALSDAAPTNTILTEHPNIYLFGALWALFQDAMEGDVSNYFKDQFFQAIAGANATDQAGRYGPAPYIRMEGYAP